MAQPMLYLLVFFLSFGVALSFYLHFRQAKKRAAELAEKEAANQLLKNELILTLDELHEKKASLGGLNQRLMTEFNRREKLEKSSFSRDRFLAAMSNEMRTPLGIITGLTRLLRETKPRADQAELLRNLQFAANDLVVFINDVLNFSKIEVGKLNLAEREFFPAMTMADILQRFDRYARDKALLFHHAYDSKIPEKLVGDDTCLLQILTNLLTVVFQHTNEGSVELFVDLIEATSKEAVVRINVEGTTEDLDEDFFDQPLQLSGGNEEQEFDGYQGSHFSLTIARRLVELQNGRLKKVSKKGSTLFTVILPFKLPQVKKDWKEKDAMRFSEQLAGRQVLVVEDNKINQLVVAKLLRKQGVEVSTADNGLLALEIFNRHTFDLVLMDIQMPEMDGYKATAEIRRHPDPVKNSVPIIALTSSAYLTEKEKANLFGMDEHVGKPFSPEELLEKISGCLEGKVA